MRTPRLQALRVGNHRPRGAPAAPGCRGGGTCGKGFSHYGSPFPKASFRVCTVVVVIHNLGKGEPKLGSPPVVNIRECSPVQPSQMRILMAEKHHFVPQVRTRGRASALSLFLTDPRDAFILWEILGGTSGFFFFFASLFSILFGRLPFLLFFLSHPRRPLNLSRLFFSFVWGFLSVPFPGLAPSIYETGSIAW